MDNLGYEFAILEQLDICSLDYRTKKKFYLNLPFFFSFFKKKIILLI